MRLIDADALETRIRTEARERNPQEPWTEYGWVCQNIFFMPTAQPTEQERPHGHWKTILNHSDTDPTKECSYCGGTGYWFWIACPWCGADMRGAADV